MPVVAFDATPLLGERTGVGVAVSGMLQSVRAAPDLDLIGYGFTAAGWRRLRRELPAGVRPSRGPMPASALLRVWRRHDRPVLETWTGPVDLVHGTNFVVPPTRRAARLVSVWDLTAVRYPEMCTPTARRYPALIRRAVDRGAWVHTAADTVAGEIREHFGTDRVVVVPPGLDLPPVPSPAADSAPYILGLGTSEPRKDFPALVAAFDRLADRHPDLELRIAGPPGWAEHDLQAAIARSKANERIHRLGYVPDVPALIAGARVFAYPSVYEGFGLPPLEAMALGVPVVATAAGALPEVLGGAALLVTPGRIDELAEAIDTVLDDGAARERLADAGRVRAASFSWAATGEALAGVYRRLSSR